MDALCYDRTIVTTEGDSPAAFGNRIAEEVLAFGATDGLSVTAICICSKGWSSRS